MSPYCGAMKNDETKFLPSVTGEMDEDEVLRRMFRNNYTESTQSSQCDAIAKRPVSYQSKETSLANLQMMRNM